MVRMMTYKEANQILGCFLTPNNRCICKRTAIENDAQSDPLAPFANNRLVPVSKVIKNLPKYHIVILDEDGGTLYDEHLVEGTPIPNPGHPNKPGYTPAGWDPEDIPATALKDGTYRRKYTKDAIKYHIVLLDENGNVIPGYDMYLEQGATIPYPQHPAKEGYSPNGWSPAIPPTAQADGTYQMQYTKDIVKYHIILQDENGVTIPGYDMYLDEGAAIPRPDHPDKEGYSANGWEPRLPDTAHADGTYKMKYTQDLPKDPEDDSPEEQLAYTMDNIYQERNLSKPTPKTSIKQWMPVGGHWWSGPLDGKAADSTYGVDNGISAKVVNNRPTVTSGSTTYFYYDTDSCIYEYARPAVKNQAGDDNNLVVGADEQFSNITASDLLSDWECACYDGGGNYIGQFTMHSNNPWVKFVPVYAGWTLTDKDPNHVDSTKLVVPFAIRYYFATNSGDARKGTVTVTTPGGKCHYYANHWLSDKHPHKGLQYITNTTVHIYQQGVTDK